MWPGTGIGRAVHLDLVAVSSTVRSGLHQLLLRVPEKSLYVKMPHGPQAENEDSQNPESGDVRWQRLRDRIPIEFDGDENLSQNNGGDNPRLGAELLAVSEKGI